MSIFGGSYPAGCSGTPYDESQAEELKVSGLPDNVNAFWVDGETIQIQQRIPDAEYPATLVCVEYLGDDELTEAGNSAQASLFAQQKWDEYLKASA